MSPKRYSSQFKQDAVELLLNGSKSLKPLARDLGVTPSTLREWRDLYLGSIKQPSQGPPRGPAPGQMADELQRLRRENETLKRQRDILKKALGILSEPSPNGMP